jgi:signal transduction histidine kinase/ligand-binding sensor domain-containing protein
MLAALLSPTAGWALDPARDIHQYICQTWTRQSGLPAAGISAIAQTGDGYLWLGTQSGLVRFDGVRFSAIALPDDSRFQRRVIASLASSRTGGLWFGLAAAGGFGFRDEQGAFFRPHGPAWLNTPAGIPYLWETSDGSLWVGRNDGLIRYTPGNPAASTLDDRLPAVRAMVKDAHERVWLLSAGTGLHAWQEGQLTPFPDKSFNQTQATAVAVDLQDRIWIGTTTELRCYDASFRRLDLPPFTQNVRALLVDQHGVIWIGTHSGGLACYKNGTFSFLRQRDGLANDHVTSLLEDREGSLWVGTHGGLSQLADVKFPLYSDSEGLLDEMCHGVCASANGGLWIGTSLGVTYFDGRTATNFTPAQGLSFPYIKRPFEARNGDVYLMNARMGIDVMSGGKVVTTVNCDKWPTAFAEDSQGVIVAVAGALFRISRAGLAPYPLKDHAPLSLTWIRDLHSSRNGDLWVASVQGILRIRDGVIRQWTTAGGIPDHDVYSLCEDRDGVMWAGLKTGLARIKGDRFSNISRRDGLLDDSIQAIVADDLGHLWVNSSQGIFRVSLAQLNDFLDGRIKRVESVAYNGQNVVKTIDSAEAEFMGCKTADGRIWFPTPQGAVAIDPAHIPVNPIAPPVHIERIRANSRELTTRGLQVVPPGPGELEFHFTALSFVAPQQVRFRYRLEGYDPDWVETMDRRQVFYTNLRPGRYTFRVTAANADGIWSDHTATLEIELRPHFYQAAWFHLLCGALGLGVIVGIYRWRVRVLHRREQALQENRVLLENEVRHRTAELQNEIARRMRVEEDLRATNRELEAFSYSVSHDLRAPLRGIAGFSRALLEDYHSVLDAEGQDYLRRICAASLRMSQLIDDLLMLARISRDELRHEPVDLSALATTVADALRQAHPDRRIDFVITPGLHTHGDARLLRLALENLFGNAVKFSSKRPEARIEFGRTERNGAPAFFVRDNGAGFDPSSDKLFGAFQRFHTAAEFPGTGIGLATVQRVIQRHGGHIEAESQPDHGATFYFTLPVQPGTTNTNTNGGS